MDKTNSELPTIKYPEIGAKVKCVVQKASFTQAILKIIEIEGFKSLVNYRAIIKGMGVGEEIYVCDQIKTGDLIDCVVISNGDNGLFVSQL